VEAERRCPDQDVLQTFDLEGAEDTQDLVAIHGSRVARRRTEIQGGGTGDEKTALRRSERGKSGVRPPAHLGGALRAERASNPSTDPRRHRAREPILSPSIALIPMGGW
jgi:hypothetical protein